MTNKEIAEKALCGFPMTEKSLGFHALEKVYKQIVEVLDKKDEKLKIAEEYIRRYKLEQIPHGPRR